MSRVEQSRRIQLLGQRHWRLLAIIGLYLLLGILYMRTMPPFEGPDEPQHMAYISWLAEGKGFPPQGDAAWETPVEQEAGQSPLYYLIASVPARLIDLESPEAVFRSNPHAFTGPWPRIVPDNDNRAIHYPGDANPMAGGWLALYSARVISLLFGVLLIVSTYGFGRQVAPGEPKIAVASALLLAVTPQVIFISSVASNDIPAATFSALTLWLLARMINLGLSAKRAVAIGLVYGLAVLSKSSAAALGLALGLALAWFWLTKRSTIMQVLWTGFWLATGAMISAGWWLARSWILYQSPLGLSTHDQTPWAIQDPEAIARGLMRWLDVFRSYWITLGWGTIRPHGELVYVLLLSMAMAAGVGFIVLLVSTKERLSARPAIRPILIAIMLVAILGVALSLEMWMHRVIAPYGRLMFPAAAAISVLLVSGWYALHPRLPFTVAGFVVVLAISAPFLLVRPAFATPEPLDEQRLAQLGPGLGIQFGPNAETPVAELLSATVLDKTPDPLLGSRNISTELCWRPLRQTEIPYTVLTHIIGPEDLLVAQRRTYPGLGHYPTTIWQPGEAFCDHVRILLWQAPARTLAYQLEIAFMDTASGERLTAFDPNGDPMEVVFTDRVRLAAKPDNTEDLSFMSDGTGPLELVSTDFSKEWRAGLEQTVGLTWRVAEVVDRDYQVFAHLQSRKNNQTIVQADGPPLDGWYPTSWWQAGELVVDTRRFTLPADIEPGSYDVLVGFYDLATGERYGTEYNLGTVQVGS